jgi:[protein-PII] uridylyltransferase
LEFIDEDRIAPEVISQHWASFPNDYFLRYSAKEIALHINMIASTAAIQLPLVDVQHDPNLAANVFLVYAPETERLLSLVTGGFARMNLNIVDARIHATPAGFALFTFIALEKGDRQASDPETLQRLKHRLRNEIVNPALERPRKQTHIPRTLKHFPIETRVSFTQSPSGQHTMMEVVAQDQPGLLHEVARCLSECKVKLATAKIATYGERAEDIFFITDRDGNLVTKHSQQTCLAHRIQRALSLDTQSKSPQAASL